MYQPIKLVYPKLYEDWFLLFLLLINKMTIDTKRMMSFIKEVLGLKGIQSPKQPQVLIFPENNA
jgi:hypothetical protein